MSLTAEQIELRRNIITCSRLPMILDLSEYGHPIEVYNAMVFGESGETNRAQRAGNRHEEALLREFEEQHECVLAIPEDGIYNKILHEFGFYLRAGKSATFIYPEQLSVKDGDSEVMKNWFGGTPDAIIAKDSEFLRQLFDLRQSAVGAVVQAKLVNSRKAHEWGESQFGEPPKKVLAQVYGEIILAREVLKTKINFGFVVALIGEPTQADYRFYCVHVDDETEKYLLDAGREFWYIVQRQEVEKLSPEGNWQPYFQQRWPKETVERKMDEDGSAAVLWRELIAAKQKAVVLNSTIVGFENALKMKMGDAALLYAGDPSLGKNGLLASWKKAKDSKNVDWEAVARALCKNAKGKITPKVQAALDSFIEANTKTTPGSRRFLVKGVNGSADE